MSRVSRAHDLVRESSRNLQEEFEDPSDLLERPTGKNSTVVIHRCLGCMDAHPWVFWGSMDGRLDCLKEFFH